MDVAGRAQKPLRRERGRQSPGSFRDLEGRTRSALALLVHSRDTDKKNLASDGDTLGIKVTSDSPVGCCSLSPLFPFLFPFFGFSSHSLANELPNAAHPRIHGDSSPVRHCYASLVDGSDHSYWTFQIGIARYAALGQARRI